MTTAGGLLRLVVLGGGGALAMAGCETFMATAPPVSPTMIARAAPGGISSDFLKSGRQLLATRCTACHSLEPIAKYSANGWCHVVDEMAGRANLTENERRQIAAYLVAARRELPQ